MIITGLQREIVEDELKSVQRHATAKAARKKLTGTVAQKGGIITIGDVRASFQAREESELQKAEAVAQKQQSSKAAFFFNSIRPRNSTSY